MRRLSWILLLVACASGAEHEARTLPPSGSEAPVVGAAPTSTAASSAASEPGPAPRDCTKYRDAVMNMKDAADPALLMEAADCLHADGKLGAAIAIWRAVVMKFTGTPDGTTAMRRAGEAYEQIGHFAEAADMYDEYARRYPKEADAEEKLVKATCFRHSLGQEREAANDADLLTRNYRRPLRKPEEICANK
jgi:TolA-binding protein